MYLFKNLSEFYACIHNPTVIAVDYVVDKIMDELEIQMVNKRIGLNSNSFYTPTGDFYRAWKSEITTRVGQYFTNKVKFDGDSMTLDPNNFIHGSNYYDVNDVRDIMPDIIFGGQSGDLFGEGFWTHGRDAWSPTISRINKSFGKWIIEGFKYAGFTVKKDTTSIIMDID